MPFNRVTNLKATVFWLLILNKENEEKKFGPGDVVKRLQKVPTYIPGLILVPIPEAGLINGYIDMAFWGVFLYLLGSVFYVVDSFFLWELTYDDINDDANNPGVYWNTVAAVLFVVNALVCFLDWHLQFKQLSAMNMAIDDNITGGLSAEEIPQKQSIYYFYNNLFFLGAAVVYLIQSIWMENIDTDLLGCSSGFCGSFWINFWGSFLYLLSSVFSVAETFENTRLRKEQGLPPLKYFSCKMHEIDWFGWGDWLYLLISLYALLQSFLQSFVDDEDDFIGPYYLTENVLFLLDSIAYFVGYMLFLWDLRQALATGMVDENSTGAISTLIGDNYVEKYEDLEPFGVEGNSNNGFSGGARISLFTTTAVSANNVTASANGMVERPTAVVGADGRLSASNRVARTTGSKVSMADIKLRLLEAKEIRQLRRSGQLVNGGTSARPSTPARFQQQEIDSDNRSAGNPMFQSRNTIGAIELSRIQ